MSAPTHASEELDAAYVEAALSRAGEPAPTSPITVEVLTGGRTGMPVRKVHCGHASYVVKVALAEGWRQEAMEAAPGGEAALWLSGVTRDLPEGLDCPVLDVSVGPNEAYWMLMRDIGPGIRPRGGFTDRDEVALLDRLARLHAEHWESPALDALPLASMRGTTRAWARPVAALIRGPEAVASSPAWVRAFLDDVSPSTGLVPRMLELLSPADQALYLELLEDESWYDALDAGPQTLVHGDLRRANIAFEGETVSLIDWELAAKGPAATDLGWHWFLHFWAYPPDDRHPDEREPLRQRYLSQLEAALGAPIDRDAFERQWNAAWLRILSQLGFCLGDGSDREAARARAARAFERARRARDAL